MDDEMCCNIINERDCVPLKDVLLRLGSPLSEELAWALCYSVVESYIRFIQQNHTNYSLLEDLQQIVFHKDGHIHDETFHPPSATISVSGQFLPNNSYVTS